MVLLTPERINRRGRLEHPDPGAPKRPTVVALLLACAVLVVLDLTSPALTPARRLVGEVPPGTLIHLIATDPAAPLDLPAWCHLTGNHYFGPVASGPPTYGIRTAVRPARTEPNSPWQTTSGPPRRRNAPASNQDHPTPATQSG